MCQQRGVTAPAALQRLLLAAGLAPNQQPSEGCWTGVLLSSRPPVPPVPKLDQNRLRLIVSPP